MPERYPELKEIDGSEDDDESKAKAFAAAFEKIMSELRENRKLGEGGRRRGAIMKRRGKHRR